MSISIGGIDLASSIINLEYEMYRTQRILEWVLKNNSSVKGPSPHALGEIDAAAIEMLQKKFPEAGIKKK